MDVVILVSLSEQATQKTDSLVKDKIMIYNVKKLKSSLSVQSCYCNFYLGKKFDYLVTLDKLCLFDRQLLEVHEKRGIEKEEVAKKIRKESKGGEK